MYFITVRAMIIYNVTLAVLSEQRAYTRIAASYTHTHTYTISTLDYASHTYCARI